MTSNIRTELPKTSGNSTCIVSRHFLLPPSMVFDAWLDPEIRAKVLQRSVYKKCIKELNPVEGGIERYEQRWKNTLYGQSVRTYLSIRRPTQIIAKICNTPTKASIAGFLPRQEVTIEERLEFKKADRGTMLVVSEEFSSVWRNRLASLTKKDRALRWNLDLDIFEEALTNS